MRVRRQIAAIALVGVQLLQGVLPAAGGLCEREQTTALAPAPSVHEHHHMQGAPNQESSAPESAPASHPHAPASCPMAMACSAVGVISSAVVVSTVDVAVDVHRPVHVADWPVSLDIAPEPPPPRG